jgi:hypothetical protein
VTALVEILDTGLVYAFHKKSQELQEKEKETIRSRIRRIEL